jgi:hypothetical protein
MTERLLPDRPFPPYTFVPGRVPHPVSDPAGHSFGVTPAAPPAPEPQRWEQSATYRYGIDLFNAGFYWEAHVEFESLWVVCGKKGPVADFLKGLIHLAAAGVKRLEGRPQGVTGHACRAAELWHGVARTLAPGEEGMFGFRVAALGELAAAIGKAGWPEVPPQLRPTLP